MSIVRALARWLRIVWRMGTAKMRVFPDFLVIGAQRSGTTSLYNCIIQHPNVKPALGKEIHYFENTQICSENWYRARFPISTRKPRSWVTGEATPLYLFHPDVPQRVARLLPNVKLIIILREPISRAFSQYNHEKRHGHIQQSFDDVVRAECLPHRKIIADESPYDLKHRNILARGRYVEQIKRWRTFFENKQMLVINFKDFVDAPIPELNKVFRFLGITENVNINNVRKNAGDYSEGPSVEMIEQLKTYYSAHNEELADMMGDHFQFEVHNPQANRVGGNDIKKVKKVNREIL